MPKSWRDYFDVIVVSANKPLFFEEGTMLREVDVVWREKKERKVCSLCLYIHVSMYACYIFISISTLEVKKF